MACQRTAENLTDFHFAFDHMRSVVFLVYCSGYNPEIWFDTFGYTAQSFV